MGAGIGECWLLSHKDCLQIIFIISVHTEKEGNL